jgi:hypothetical protein
MNDAITSNPQFKQVYELTQNNRGGLAINGKPVNWSEIWQFYHKPENSALKEMTGNSADIAMAAYLTDRIMSSSESVTVTFLNNQGQQISLTIQKDEEKMSTDTVAITGPVKQAETPAHQLSAPVEYVDAEPEELRWAPRENDKWSTFVRDSNLSMLADDGSVKCSFIIKDKLAFMSLNLSVYGSKDSADAKGSVMMPTLNVSRLPFGTSTEKYKIDASGNRVLDRSIPWRIPENCSKLEIRETVNGTFEILIFQNYETTASQVFVFLPR